MNKLICCLFLSINVLTITASAQQDTSGIDHTIRNQLHDLRHNGLDTSGLSLALLNNFFFDQVFKYTSDKKMLSESVHWMKKIVDLTPGEASHLDTYANLLYKSGRKKEALECEEKALSLELKKAMSESRDPDPIYAATIEKMKKDIPTWK